VNYIVRSGIEAMPYISSLSIRVAPCAVRSDANTAIIRVSHGGLVPLSDHPRIAPSSLKGQKIGPILCVLTPPYQCHIGAAADVG
jgi:hypothetical protein